MEITVKQLIKELKSQPENNTIDFGGLNFYRLDDKGDITVFEFDQTISLDDEGNVQVQNHS